MLLRSITRRFHRLSSTTGHVAHALLTLSPVAVRVLLLHAAPRLACVKPAASVHPEPGSNSSLYNYKSKLDSLTYLRLFFTITASDLPSVPHNPKVAPVLGPRLLCPREKIALQINSSFYKRIDARSKFRTRLAARPCATFSLYFFSLFKDLFSALAFRFWALKTRSFPNGTAKVQPFS